MGVARSAVDFSLDKDQDGIIDLSEGCIALVLSKTGSAARMVAKYRPPCPAVVASSDDQTLRQTGISFGLHPLKVGPCTLVVHYWFVTSPQGHLPFRPSLSITGPAALIFNGWKPHVYTCIWCCGLIVWRTAP